jgi:hypothetical protein
MKTLRALKMLAPPVKHADSRSLSVGSTGRSGRSLNGFQGARSAIIRSVSVVCFVGTLLVAGVGRNAYAGFIGPYAFGNFILNNTTQANGSATLVDPGTLVITGPNDGSGDPGTTDFTILVGNPGIVQFSYLYNSNDIPGFDFAGYILSNAFHQFADTDGQSGIIVFPVYPGDVFGFRVGTADNQGEAGVLTITNFDVTVPEPAGYQLSFLGLGALVAFAAWRHRSAMRALLGPWLGRALILCMALPLVAQQASYSGSNVTGQLVLSGVVNLRQVAQTSPAMALRNSMLSRGFPGRGLPTPTLQGPELLRKIPSERLHPPINENVLALAAAPIFSKSLAISTSATSSGFNALSQMDQRLADSGNQFSIEPPNLNIAVANGYVLEGVNDAIQVYSVSGSPSLPLALSSNQFFGLGHAINRATGANGVYLTDMRVYYDSTISRFIVVQRSQDEDIFGNPLGRSHLYMGVSKTTDPTGDYNIYVMETTNASHAGCPCVDDYPQIGSDQYGFHIAWNEFNAFGLYFVDASILSLSKASLAAGTSQPTAVQFLLQFATHYETSIQPATTPPGASNFLANGGLEYFVSTTGSLGGGVSLWAMTNTSSLATASPTLTLLQIIIPTLGYSLPNLAAQREGTRPYGSSLFPPGALPFLDPGDTRVQSLSYASGRLFLTMQTAVTDEGGHSVDGGAYIVLSPTYRSGVLAASVLSQGYLFVNGVNLLRPSLAVNAQGRGAIVATLVGSQWYPSAAYIPIDNLTTPLTLQVAGQGTLPEDGFTGYPAGGGLGVARWGDYNSAVAASDGSVWLGAQYIGNFPRTQFANWNTYVIHVQ